MQQTDTRQASSQGSRTKRQCCTDSPCDLGLRNQYFEGKRLTADSFRVEQSYGLERRRLLNRAVHGWGVVYGYALKPAPLPSNAQTPSGRLEIGPGLALDECGRELLHTRATLLGFDEVVLLDAKGARLQRPPDGSFKSLAAQASSGDQPAQLQPPACWLLSAHYAEQAVGPVRVNDPCSCERYEWDRVCETVRFSLRRIDCKDCCKVSKCKLKCGCGAGPCCEESIKPPVDPDTPVQRGGCQCLCNHLMSMTDVKCGGLSQIDDPCVHIDADLCHGVPLACVALLEGECGDWLFDSWIEACGPRRLVKSNDALFDLIRGCDLTRISKIGWAEWHRATRLIEWDDFEDSFGGEDEDEREHDRDRRGRPKRRRRVPAVTEKYWVEFSRPVRKETVRADCFSMTIFVEAREGGWDQSFRVPIIAVVTSAKEGTPAGHVTKATIAVDAGWLSSAVRGQETIFNEEPTTVEIEIRGDLIVDCNGQTVDADAHGLWPAPSGNGTPGGTFFSRFHVQPRDAERRLQDTRAEYTEGVE